MTRLKKSLSCLLFVVEISLVDSPGEQAPPIETTAVPTSTIRKSPVISTVGEIVVASKPSPRTEELSLNEVTRMDTERVLKKVIFSYIKLNFNNFYRARTILKFLPDEPLKGAEPVVE